MPTNLKRLKISRVDLVDSPANQFARIVLYKRSGPKMKMSQSAKEVLSAIAKALGFDEWAIRKMEHEMEQAQDFNECCFSPDSTRCSMRSAIFTAPSSILCAQSFGVEKRGRIVS